MSLPARLFTEIRHGIVEGRYRPHQRLVENELAKELSASRTPVRQALQRLELEGLVVASRHGWVIREHSAEDIHQIYDVRMALESFASRLATAKASDEDLEILEAAYQRMRSYEESAPNDESQIAGTSYVELHDLFHDAIVRCAGNAVLRDAIRSYREHPYNRRVAHTYSIAERQTAAESHEKMLSAICVRLPDEAERLTREHLVLSRDVTLQRVGQRI